MPKVTQELHNRCIAAANLLPPRQPGPLTIGSPAQITDQQRRLLNATAAAFPLGEIISLQQLSDTLHVLNEIEGGAR